MASNSKEIMFIGAVYKDTNGDLFVITNFSKCPLSRGDSFVIYNSFPFPQEFPWSVSISRFKKSGMEFVRYSSKDSLCNFGDFSYKSDCNYIDSGEMVKQSEVSSDGLSVKFESDYDLPSVYSALGAPKKNPSSHVSGLMQPSWITVTHGGSEIKVGYAITSIGPYQIGANDKGPLSRFVDFPTLLSELMAHFFMSGIKFQKNKSNKIDKSRIGKKYV